MPIRRIRFARRAALASCVALAALSAAAFAKDLPPSSDGAAKLQAFLTTYLGKSAPATITPADPGYTVAFDLAAATGPFKAAGFSFDQAATAKYHVIEQDDGAWRVEFSDFPTLVAHVHTHDGDQPLDGTETIAFTGIKGQSVIDPAIGFWRSVTSSADGANVTAKFPGIDETVQVGGTKADGTGQASADGAVSAALTQTAASVNFKFDVDPKAVKAAKGGDPTTTDAQPYSVTIATGPASADIKLDGLKTRPLLDLWAFLVAHPSRPELAANEAAFKSLLAAALAGQTKADETASIEKIAAQLPQGQVTIDSAKFGFSGALGPTGAFGQRFEANGLTLPADLIPGPFKDFAPTAFAIGFRASGFDVPSAAAEMIADMHLAGDGPVISPDDTAKIHAKLIGPDGIVVDIEPSHVTAPLLDIAFEGHVVYKGGKPTGKLTVHMRNFDKTQAALKTLGPDVEKKVAPMLAMAKGLAKTDGDGSLMWVGEIGADGVMKVNGLPLGKAPI